MFNDGFAASDWALDAMAWCVENGLMRSIGNGNLSPKTTLTYAQLAQFMMNYSKFVDEQGNTVTPEPTPVVTPGSGAS